jgi:hypothetical protein
MKNLFWILAVLTALIWGAYAEIHEVEQQGRLAVEVAR